MKYVSDFTSINGLKYRLSLLVTDSYINRTRTLTLASSPFTTTMDSGDTIYKPVKYCGATANIITSDYCFNLYNPTITDVGVMLTCGSDVVFKGYVTPNLYNQGFKYDNEEIAIECVDCLSALKNINYLPPDMGIKNFKDIILYILRQINIPNSTSLNSWLRNVYFPNSYTFSGEDYDSSNVLECFYVSDYAFMGDKKDDQKDEDVCWKCSDVLEAICQYLGVTCVQWGEDVYFIDYDYLMKNYIGDETYIVYDINTGALKSDNLHIGDTINITGDIYSGGSDPQLSLDKVYNKVTVKTALRIVDNLVPDFFDTATNITEMDGENGNGIFIKDHVRAFTLDYTDDLRNETNKKMVVVVSDVYNDEHRQYENCNIMAVRYVNNPAIKCYSYSNEETGKQIEAPTTMNYSKSLKYRGGMLAKMMVVKLDNQWSYFDFGNLDNFSYEQKLLRLDTIMIWNNIRDISFSNYICLFNPANDNHRINNNDDTSCDSKPFIEIELPLSTSFIGGVNAYLLLSGTIIWHHKDEYSYPVPVGQFDPTVGIASASANNLFLACKLQWGDKFWNGAVWSNYNTWFKLHYTDPKEYTGAVGINSLISLKTYRFDGLICKGWEIPNSVSWRIGTNEKGYVIPVPEDYLLLGTPKFTIYRPFDPSFDKTGTEAYKPNRMFIKDFEIKPIMGDPSYSKTPESDTCYTNIINKNFVDELQDITFNISTYDNKAQAFNTVAQIKHKNESNSGYCHVDKVTNIGLRNGEDEWNSSDNDAPEAENGLRFEEHFIYRLVNQYSSPSKILDLSIHGNVGPWWVATDHTLNDCKFIIDSINTDFKYNSQKLRLVEKK